MRSAIICGRTLFSFIHPTLIDVATPHNKNHGATPNSALVDGAIILPAIEAPTTSASPDALHPQSRLFSARRPSSGKRKQRAPCRPSATPRSSLGVHPPPRYASGFTSHLHAHMRPLLAVRVRPPADADPPACAASSSFSFHRPRTFSDSSLALRGC
ncbi:hypothetical protein C8R44DRAFT_871651 [Mycena epipterygia]|nr:hypothetical protein C8R44DRAFT_871651 [Mycena epipterygia]